MVVDQLTGRPRAPAAAFRLREKEEALSVNVETSLRAAELPLTWRVDFNKQYAVCITVGDCIANGLEAFHDPVAPKSPDDPGNPHHGSIYGLAEVRSRDLDAYEAVVTALAKASTVLPEQ